MKRFILCLLATLFTLQLSAQQSAVRKFPLTKGLEPIDKKEVVEKKLFIQRSAMMGDEMHLSRMKSESLNDIERGLLSKYSEVVVSPKVNAYFIIDSEDKIGVATPEGEVIVEPCEGRVYAIMGKYVIVGDITGDFSSATWPLIARLNTSNDIRYPSGYCKAVFEYNKSDFIPLIGSSRYDIVQLCLEGIMNIDTFYVAKVNEEGVESWGVCDGSGKEILPCEYKSIRFFNKTYIGSTTEDWDQMKLTIAIDQLIAVEKRTIKQLKIATVLYSVAGAGLNSISIKMALNHNAKIGGTLEANFSEEQLRRINESQFVTPDFYKNGYRGSCGSIESFMKMIKNGEEKRGKNPCRLGNYNSVIELEQLYAMLLRLKAASRNVVIEQSEWENATL